MYHYNLRSRDEIIEEVRILGARRDKLEREFKLNMDDVLADVAILKAELELLKSIGKS